jgi:hypothetical protein
MELDNEYILNHCPLRQFSKAAEALHMTQPALSIAIRKAETRLGTPLFDRKKTPAPTDRSGCHHMYVGCAKSKRWKKRCSGN